ncbi:Bcr/CflA family multidrug efflux MFS transporter [Ferrovibrio sp.]|uniref:Bcr/CflA family multidrug efflux MFS transporter n=1 Tax=Ferrovibrio sp. TaxID=1917215 RepID=UPI00311FB274
MSASPSPAKPGASSLWRLTLVLGALSAFTPLAVDMYLPGLPTLERAFGTDAGRVQMTLSVFFVGLALGQLLLGPVSDRFGRRRPLLAGNLLFIAASAGCALAADIDSLIAWRFLEAVGACAGLVIGRAMVRDLFEPRDMAKVFALLMLVIGVAPILAPLLGGYLLVWFDWHAIFWFMAAFGVVAMAAGAILLPETHDPATAQSLHLGRVLAGYGSLLVNRRFMGYTLASSLGMAGMFAYIAGSPFVFIDLYGVPADAFGWIFGANAIGIIGMAQVNRLLLRRFTLDEVLIAAVALVALAGLVLLATAASGVGGMIGIWLPLFFYIASLGAVLPNAGASAMAGEGARAGMAAALMGTLQFAAGAVSSGLLGLLQDGTALPLAGIIAACGLSGLAARLILVR